MANEVKVNKLAVLTDIRVVAVVAGVAILGHVFSLWSADVMNIFLSLAGVQGLAGVRKLIDSSGKKTYVLAASGVLMVVAYYFAAQFDFVDPEAVKTIAQGVLGIVFGAAAYTLHDAKRKAE